MCIRDRIDTDGVKAGADNIKDILKSLVLSCDKLRASIDALSASTVSYTHLDVYKRQGKSIEDIFKGLITDKDGNQIPNIVVDEGQQKAEQNKAKFTTKFTGTGNGGMTKDDFRKLSLDERTKLKQSDPELYEAMRK